MIPGIAFGGELTCPLMGTIASFLWNYDHLNPHLHNAKSSVCSWFGCVCHASSRRGFGGSGGASWGSLGRTFLPRIILPLTKSGFLSAFVLTFITAMRALDEIALLVTLQTRAMTFIIFRFQQQSFTQHTYGITVLIVSITLFWKLPCPPVRRSSELLRRELVTC